MPRRPALRTELLLNLAFLAAVALLLVALTSVLVNLVAPDRVVPYVLAFIALDVAIFIGFGHYLVTKLVLAPMQRIIRTADAVAGGDLAARAPDAETRDFAALGERINRMTDFLLDAQGQLVRTEKLATMGRVAAGIAHEVGNPLGAIGTYVDVLRRRGGDPQVVEGIQAELGRIDEIVRSLLDYARQGDSAPEVVDPAVTIRGAFSLLEAQGALKGVRATLDLPDGLPAIRARPHLLRQAIVNIVLNAIDAAPGGVVALGARRWQWRTPRQSSPHRLTDDPAAWFQRRTEPRPARIEFAAHAAGTLIFVADDGPGVPREHRDRIFEPFFTTKEPGRGTGLGLAIVARAVEEMGGVVWVDTAREGGAAFKMFFPSVGAAS
ncbi:MAG: HAMP domain-containing sensor histidine kinase [Gemmatimonadota bacterium]|nr:HAMP domain-containing sensor histidine kinase [Gemmatimonadota bacterium]